MIREGLRKRLRGLFRARRTAVAVAGDRLVAPPEQEERDCLVSPDGRERIFFYRRSDGLWAFVVEAFAFEEHSDMGCIPGYWYPAHFSGLHDSLATAKREAAGGRPWVLDGEGG